MAASEEIVPVYVGEERTQIATADQAVEYVLRATPGAWRLTEHHPGWALANIFGRMTDVMLTRLHQAPEKHFLAFLNEAGIDLLPARAATAEVTFIPGPDSPDVVEVPAGTQVATARGDDAPEIIFETEHDLNVTPNALKRCLVLDPVSMTDVTEQASGAAPSTTGFRAFTGDQERERVLYLGDDELFAFNDEACRSHATITLNLESENPGDPTTEGWSLEWMYWDGITWQLLPAEIAGTSEKFSVTLALPPSMQPHRLEDGCMVWLACKLIGGTAREKLPAFKEIKGARKVEIGDELTARRCEAFVAFQSGAAFAPVDTTLGFHPLGPAPARSDAFYLRCDEAATKTGATLTLEFVGLEGVPVTVTSANLAALVVRWEYSTQDGWHDFTESASDGNNTKVKFTDFTCGFTKSASDGNNSKVTFTVPSTWAAHEVNGIGGYWLRATLIDGGYMAAERITADKVEPALFVPRVYAPWAAALKVSYIGFSETKDIERISTCRSRVDGAMHDHGADIATKKTFAPFTAEEEGLGLYLGFERAFPAGSWIQLLLDVVEAMDDVDTGEEVVCEYFSDRKWMPLSASDETQGLRKRGYLGFFAPPEHACCALFGHEAAWLRLRPVQLLQAAAGADQVKMTSVGVVDVVLDASASTAAPGRSIVRYHWSEVTRDPTHAHASASRRLRVIRLNTVTARNAMTWRDEVLGSGTGKPDQRFRLSRAPILPGAAIAVREIDRPSAEELANLEAQLRSSQPAARALLGADEVGGREGVWVRWCEVADFRASAPEDRHFTLDANTGEVCFGNGEAGKVPPIGRNNILAATYRTHQGQLGNVAARAIISLRNPSSELAALKGVTNAESAAGGTAPETVRDVKLRGPQALKHGGRAMAREDFEWLAQEASSEVARAWCLPLRNRRGSTEAGWVTLVVLPHSASRKPEPSPALLRLVREHLARHALATLVAADHIIVAGPEYVEVSVAAKVVPVCPEQADDVKLDVLARLERFLHPLQGGPQGVGWSIGRDVFRSEVLAEIEAVSGVDHVAALRLLCTLQQYQLKITNKHGKPPEAPYALPVGSKVSTFDDRIMMRLALDIETGDVLSDLPVYAFKVGDRAVIVNAANESISDVFTISGLEGDEVQPQAQLKCPADMDDGAALMSIDRVIRLPLTDETRSIPAGQMLDRLCVRGFDATHSVSVVAGGRRDPGIEFLRVSEMLPRDDRVFVPEGHLVCSSNHDVEMVLR